jgi:oxygen-dependent protoporphyrinogen oxidase
VPRVVIVGGGISGLSAAYYLHKAGIRPTLIEKQPHLGGVIRTERVEGCLIEAGPEAYLAAKPAATELIQELGIADQLIGSNDHLRVTFVVRNGKLVPLPEGLMMMAPTRVWPMVTTRLLSWPAKIRMGLEYFRRPPSQPLADRSVSQFISDHYGSEAVDYLTEPLLAGVYGGNPDEMSVRSVLTRFAELEQQYGSLTRGVLAEKKKAPRNGKTGSSPAIFRTLKNGLGQLVDAIASRNPADVIRGSVEVCERSGPGYRLKIAGQWMEAEHVILACPAHDAAALISGNEPELASLLSAIPYTSSMTVALGYPRNKLNHSLNGFGFLVPARERSGIVACTWVGTKFAYRVPADKALIRCFYTRVDLSDTDAIEGAREDLRRLMGVTAEPSFTRLARWPRSMAQYTVGHQQRMLRVSELVAKLPGLHLAGNAYSGIGIPDCVRLGKKAASEIIAA